MTRINDAISAYANAARGPLEKPDTDTSAAGGTGDFAAVLKDAAKVAIGAGKEAEQMSAQAIAGKADIREVVAAVNNAQLTLETVVAVRDKVINAYNEILRMPI
ncbi:MAG: flagellar hook-basal body complex protein FliE [Actinomycetota bacterium]